MSASSRLIGGSPGIVVIKVLLLSLVVGFVLAQLGLVPTGLMNLVYSNLDWLWSRALTVLGPLLYWIKVGAVIVVPIWLILLIFARRG